jgi:hypothetical protein
MEKRRKSERETRKEKKTKGKICDILILKCNYIPYTRIDSNI